MFWHRIFIPGVWKKLYCAVVVPSGMSTAMKQLLVFFICDLTSLLSELFSGTSRKFITSSVSSQLNLSHQHFRPRVFCKQQSITSHVLPESIYASKIAKTLRNGETEKKKLFSKVISVFDNFLAHLKPVIRVCGAECSFDSFPSHKWWNNWRGPRMNSLLLRSITFLPSASVWSSTWSRRRSQLSSLSKHVW